MLCHLGRGHAYMFVCTNFDSTGGQHGNAARMSIWGETSKTDHTQKQCSFHSTTHKTIKALAILRCIYGSDMVLLRGGGDWEVRSA